MTREIKDGKLYFDGCDTTELAREYGTPLYVMSETDIIEHFSQLRKEFTDKYPKTCLLYTSMPLPTSLESLCVPPKPGVIPRPTSGCPNLAFEEAILKSQAMASSQPPPRAKPFTAAITGFSTFYMKFITFWP